MERVNISRRGLGRLAAGLAGGFVLARPRAARAAEFSFKLGHAFPLAHPFHVNALNAAQRIKQESSERVDIEVFGAAQLGGDYNMLSQVRSGGLELYASSGSVFATLFPVASMWALGFAFSNYDQVWAAVDGEVGDHVRSAARDIGLVPFNVIWDNGFRHISTGARPTAGPDDLKGLKIRVPVSPGLISLFQHLGSSPVSMNFGEVYMALQTGLVDGMESPLSVYDTGKIYEVQKYIAMSNHAWDGALIVANSAFWKTVPADVQTLVARIFDEEGRKQRAASSAQADTLRASLTGRGMIITDLPMEPMTDVLKQGGYYREWRQKYGEAGWKSLVRYSPGLG